MTITLNRRRVGMLAVAAACLLLAVGCTSNSKNQTSSDAVAGDAATNAAAIGYMNKVQPVEIPPYSQYRQVIIDAERALATGVSTWTIATEMGIPDPIFECPSIGPAVPEDSNLTPDTNVVPVDNVGDGNSRPDHLEILPTIEPGLGAYVGNTEGTYVICTTPDPLNPADTVNYLARIEAHANQFTIPMKWDATAKRMVVDQEAFLKLRQQTGTELARFTDCKKDPAKCKADQAAKVPTVGQVTPDTKGK